MHIDSGDYTFLVSFREDKPAREFVYYLHHGSNNWSNFMAEIRSKVDSDERLRAVDDHGVMLTRDMSVEEFMKNCDRDSERYKMYLMTDAQYKLFIRTSTGDLVLTIEEKRRSLSAS
ncbi:hypothetical protein GGF42_008720 [Coemansia sp. RSA 2424]|nr:hypothetical protein GGF42_008720 [Coemansia sp. RSA 2424]